MCSPYQPPINAFTPRTHPCPLSAEERCPLMFQSGKLAVQHASSTHAGLPCKFMGISDCNLSFYSQHELNEHQEWFPHAELPLPCPLDKYNACHRRCANAADQQAHLKALHADEVYACPDEDCGLVFTAPGFVKEHVKSEHSVQARKAFPCPMAKVARCGSVFVSANSAKYHARKMHARLEVECPGKEEWECELLFESKEFAEIHARHDHRAKSRYQWLGGGK
ncbi:hypothetical protein B0J12DRAFT_704322 [Macrophomina phaseolina]|uniref:C2H2-type domain-containing protein n=1 Tax=Macrophomina phaseolina TaxID=35725 RepID=A0ABQ8FWG5_9PEZI|nr:hypothetical protein B0J12DRAFT_704322 [Macrophomina phaseolina]